MKTIKIRAQQTVYYDQTVEVDDETYNKINNCTEKELRDEWNSPIADLLDFRDIYDHDGFDDVDWDDVNENI